MLPGIALCAVVGIVATWLGGLQHVVGAPILGMFIGIALANMASADVKSKITSGAAFCSKTVLRLGIILCGGTLSFATILGAGGSALPYIILSICMAFLTACLLGKYVFKVTTNTRIMVAGGTSICGGTAIATLSGVLDASEDETAYSMAAIFLFDILAALLWPYVALWLQLRPEQFSVLAGIAINDVSSVTAAGATYDMLMGDAAIAASGVTGGSLAVVVKLTRVVMLVFVALAVMFWNIYRQQKEKGGAASQGNMMQTIAKAFPVFILGFLAMAVLNTIIDFSKIGLAATTLADILKKGNKFFITVALVGVGCKIDIRTLFTRGVKPVLLGGCTWSVVAIVTLSYVLLLM